LLTLLAAVDEGWARVLIAQGSPGLALALPGPLTDRETDVLRLIAAGKPKPAGRLRAFGRPIGAAAAGGAGWKRGRVVLSACQ